MSQHRLRCEQLFDGVQFHSPGFLEICDGKVISAGAEPLSGLTETLPGLTLPGMPNLHSHAFQRVFAGLAEQRPAGIESVRDTFWSWRDLMYRFVAQLEPEDVEAIAEQAYVEMLECGYTSVAEFHYLHHGPSGIPYADVAELSRRVVAAARSAGIRMTLLPVYYEASGFGPKPIADSQRRFYNPRERFLELVSALRDECDARISLGIAPHSLRAVPLEGLSEVVEAVSSAHAGSLVHIHIAEQRREVDECVAHYGLRPVELLFRAQNVDSRFCLVHATHLSASEVILLATSGAVAGLCPTTEANLGDGLFPLGEYVQRGGRWGIGSDSQVSINLTEELRLLEYGQRLISESRNTLLRSQSDAGSGALHSGQVLVQEALVGGALALGHAVSGLTVGAWADLLVLDHDHPSLLGRRGADALDSWVFSANRPAVDRVMVHGDWLVEGGVHRERGTVQARFAKVIERLRAV